MNKLEELVLFLQKEEESCELMLDSSITTLIETGKIGARIASTKYKEKLKFIRSIKTLLEK
jgi:hypothetical protein